MSNKKVTSWKGYIAKLAMTNDGFIEAWKVSADEAERLNVTLLVFKVPNDGLSGFPSSNIIDRIQELIDGYK